MAMSRSCTVDIRLYIPASSKPVAAEMICGEALLMTVSPVCCTAPEWTTTGIAFLLKTGGGVFFAFDDEILRKVEGFARLFFDFDAHRFRI
jgi:hypothetical protein